jgi:hypothetical protein
MDVPDWASPWSPRVPEVKNLSPGAMCARARTDDIALVVPECIRERRTAR